MTRHASLKRPRPQFTAPRLQFQYELKMSLCQISRRFNRLISHLLWRNGLIRVTCLLGPHLDFYYLLPSICHSERADIFQIHCPHPYIDLSRGMPTALECPVECCTCGDCIVSEATVNFPDVGWCVTHRLRAFGKVCSDFREH